MTIEELRNKVIEEGIKEVKRTEKGAIRKGGIAGFEMCRNLTTMADFERVLRERHEQEIQMVCSGDIDTDKYWEFCSTIMQVEYTYDILKVAYNYPLVSARAGLRYAKLVGVKD